MTGQRSAVTAAALALVAVAAITVHVVAARAGSPSLVDHRCDPPRRIGSPSNTRRVLGPPSLLGSWIAAFGAAEELGAGTPDAAQPPAPRRVAWQVVEMSTGRILDTHDAELLSQAVLPGSLMKLPAMIALLESGIVTASTRIECPGAVVVDGRRIGCQHPRQGHPLSAVEAIALSCNVFFARASVGLPRERFNRVLESFGWPGPPATRPLAVAMSGVEGTPTQPAALVAAWRQLLSDPPGITLRSPVRKVVIDALAAAAHDGTAAAFTARGVDALAKTGTSVTSSGRSVGLVLAAWPGTRPTRAALVIVEGGVGPDAATVAAALAKGVRPVVPPPPAARTPPVAPPESTVTPAAPAPPPPVVPSSPITGDVWGAATIRMGTPQAGGGYVVRLLPLEDYVARVLAGEAAPRTAPAALEALAITVRTFALANRRRHAREGFDLCDSTHCQVLRDSYAATRAASDVTAGQVLAWQGAPASVFYTASCGGRTERPSAVWRGAVDPPYLPSRRDRGCRGEPRWESEISQADLQRALTASGYRGTQLRKLKIRDRADSGRVAALSLDGLTPNLISGQDFRMLIGRTLGWQVVKSTAFDLGHHRGTYTFKGHGYGHGVGFCVIGSMRRAADGESRASLLKTYFPGLQVADYRTLRLPPAPVIPPAEQAPPLAPGP